MSEARRLLAHYRMVWRQAWEQRKSMDAPTRLRHEAQFLPAALALQEQPAHPLARCIQWTIMGFLLAALVWACVGKVDMVSTASGKVVATGRSKIIQPSSVAVVKAIHVHDGQRVKAGDLLVELDAQITRADVARLRIDLLAAQIDNARAVTLLAAIEQRSEPPSLAGLIADADSQQQAAAQQWVQSQYQELRTSQDQANAEIEQKQAQIQAAHASVASLQESLPFARQLASDYQRLLGRAIVSKHAWIEREQALLAQERELREQQERIRQLQASKKADEGRASNITAQARRAMLDLQHDANQRSARLEQELNKAQELNRLTRLITPVDGTVQQLAIHTEGGVVTEAQPLMVIVPREQTVEIEAMLENKDVGFVHPNQIVEVKVETFDFTRYGLIEGVVSSVSNDAVSDDKSGLLYSVRIQLKQNTIRVNGSAMPLLPGMAVRAEIKTGERRVIDFFLSPLKAYQNDGLRER